MVAWPSNPAVCDTAMKLEAPVAGGRSRGRSIEDTIILGSIRDRELSNPRGLASLILVGRRKRPKILRE
jgi:hypothetical protein